MKKFKIWDKTNKCWFKSDGDVVWANLMPNGEVVVGDGDGVDCTREPQ